MVEQMQRSWCLWVLRLKTETTYYYLPTTLVAGIVMLYNLYIGTHI